MNSNNIPIILTILLIITGLSITFTNNNAVPKNATIKAHSENKPITPVTISTAAVMSAQPITKTGIKANIDGHHIYENGCFVCHQRGTLNAPKIDDKTAWESRLNLGGIENLINNALNGINSMPAKGGNPALTDEEVKAAVYYMLKESGLSVN